MDMTLIYAVIIVVLIGCSAFFSMSETAFTSANQIRLKKMANDGDVRAEKTLKIINNYDRFLTTILIGNNLVNIGATSLATLVFSILLGSETGALASTVIMTLAVLTFGEITPKSIAKRHPEKVCMKICSIINFIQIVLTPLSWLFTKLTAFINKNGNEDNILTEDELEVMIDEIGNDGVIEKSECDLIKSALRFDDIQASEVYVPRMDIIGVDVSDSVENLGQVITSSGFSRIPIYDGSIDNIIGVAYAKEFFTNSLLQVKFSIRDITKPIKYVPETMSIATILNDFQKSKVHMAVVLDSYGGTMGIITLEDLLEELVGDIWDESDEVMQDVINVGEGKFNVKGVANIFDAAATMGMNIDPEGYEDYSVTGFITYKLGRAPLRGDVVEASGITIRVLSVKGRRVLEAEFKRNPTPEENE